MKVLKKAVAYLLFWVGFKYKVSTGDYIAMWNWQERWMG